MSLEAIRKLVNQQNETSQRLDVEIKKTYPISSRVRFNKGRLVLTGEVTGHALGHELFVTTDTGARHRARVNYYELPEVVS
jgi:hypothetical protein